MSWNAARAALDTRMASLPSLGSSKIAWPNVVFAAPTALHYVVSFLPATVSPEMQGSDHEGGIYQVSVFVPAGGGIGAAVTAAQAVADHFKRQVFSGVSCFVPTLSPPIQDASWLQIAVSIRFQVL